MESELSRVVDSLPGLVWTARPSGEADFVNQRWCEYTGLTVDEAYGRGWLAAIHPDDLAGLLAGWQSILDSGEPRELEARMRRFDGVYRWFAFRERLSGHLKTGHPWPLQNRPVSDLVDSEGRKGGCYDADLAVPARAARPDSCRR